MPDSRRTTRWEKFCRLLTFPFLSGFHANAHSQENWNIRIEWELFRWGKEVNSLFYKWTKETQHLFALFFPIFFSISTSAWNNVEMYILISTLETVDKRLKWKRFTQPQPHNNHPQSITIFAYFIFTTSDPEWRQENGGDKYVDLKTKAKYFSIIHLSQAKLQVQSITERKGVKNWGGDGEGEEGRGNRITEESLRNKKLPILLLRPSCLSSFLL